MKQKKGFTLIELLIVVAIIAILAAIAVPNFLEAQVRSKVSRCKTDLRNFATALESYAVDHRHYPPYGTDPIVFTAGVEAQVLEPHELTTPIAYLSSGTSMNDPFRTQAPPINWAPFYFKLYNYVNWDDIRFKNVAFVHERYGEWRLAGSGPDRWFYTGTFAGPDAGVYLQISYDPTNGTVSIGDIYRTQKSSDAILFP